MGEIRPVYLEYATGSGYAYIRISICAHMHGDCLMINRLVKWNFLPLNRFLSEIFRSLCASDPRTGRKTIEKTTGVRKIRLVVYTFKLKKKKKTEDVHLSGWITVSLLQGGLSWRRGVENDNFKVFVKNLKNMYMFLTFLLIVPLNIKEFENPAYYFSPCFSFSFFSSL